MARPAAHPVDPRAPRGRPGDRHHHPQRRPLGRLGARPVGVPVRTPVHRPAGDPDPRGVPARDRVRRPPRPRQRGARRVREGALAGHHPRHALHVPRHQRAVDRRRPRQRVRPAARLPAARHRADPVHPDPHDHRPGGARDRRLAHEEHPRWPRVLRERLRPGRCRAVRSARHPAPAHRVRALRRPRRPRRRALRSPLRHHQLAGRLGLGARRGRRRGDRRRRDLRRQRHRVGRRDRRRAAAINRALPILGIPDFWQRAVVGALIIGAIVLDRVLAIRQKRKLLEAREED